MVSQVGKVKHQHGLPIYAPEREIAMLQARRLEAEKAGISADLIEDVLRRFMRESMPMKTNLVLKLSILIFTKLLLWAVMVN